MKRNVSLLVGVTVIILLLGLISTSGGAMQASAVEQQNVLMQASEPPPQTLRIVFAIDASSSMTAVYIDPNNERFGVVRDAIRYLYDLQEQLLDDINITIEVAVVYFGELAQAAGFFSGAENWLELAEEPRDVVLEQLNDYVSYEACQDENLCQTGTDTASFTTLPPLIDSLFEPVSTDPLEQRMVVLLTDGQPCSSELGCNIGDSNVRNSIDDNTEAFIANLDSRHHYYMAALAREEVWEITNGPEWEAGLGEERIRLLSNERPDDPGKTSADMSSAFETVLGAMTDFIKQPLNNAGIMVIPLYDGIVDNNRQVDVALAIPTLTREIRILTAYELIDDHANGLTLNNDNDLPITVDDPTVTRTSASNTPHLQAWRLATPRAGTYTIRKSAEEDNGIFRNDVVFIYKAAATLSIATPVENSETFQYQPINVQVEIDPPFRPELVEETNLKAFLCQDQSCNTVYDEADLVAVTDETVTNQNIQTFEGILNPTEYGTAVIVVKRDNETIDVVNNMMIAQVQIKLECRWDDSLELRPDQLPPFEILIVSPDQAAIPESLADYLNLSVTWNGDTVLTPELELENGILSYDHGEQGSEESARAGSRPFYTVRLDATAEAPDGTNTVIPISNVNLCQYRNNNIEISIPPVAVGNTAGGVNLEFNITQSDDRSWMESTGHLFRLIWRLSDADEDNRLAWLNNDGPADFVTSISPDKLAERCSDQTWQVGLDLELQMWRNGDSENALTLWESDGSQINLNPFCDS